MRQIQVYNLEPVEYDIYQMDFKDIYLNEFVHYLTNEYRVQLIESNILWK